MVIDSTMASSSRSRLVSYGVAVAAVVVATAATIVLGPFVLFFASVRP